ncbi:MAG: BT_3987 domain-containing protein [Bacteroidales bacterium]
MKHKIGFVAMTLLAVSSLFIGCDDNKDQYLEDYSTILYYKNAGDVPVTLYKTGENADYNIVVNKGGYNLKATAKVTSQIMSDAALNIYNEMHATNYVALPASCYSMDPTQVLSFTSSEDVKLVNVEFYTDKIYDLEPGINYVLPLELVDSKDSINSKLNKMFITPDVIIPTLYLKEAGEQDILVDVNSPDISTFTLSTEMPLANQWDFNCTLEVDPTLLDEFNEGSTVKYAILPKEAYEFDPTVKFTDGNSSAENPIKIDKSKIIPGDYMLPLRLTDCTKETFEIEKGKDVCLLKVSYAPQSITLNAGMLTTNAQEPSEGPISALIDGNLDTYFHSAWSVSVPNPPHYFEVKLNNPVSLIKFQYYTRHNSGNQAPQKIVVKGSNNGTDYTEIKIFDNGLPKTAKTAYTTPIFLSETAYQYLRFEVPVSTAGENKYFSMGEFKLWGE